MEKRIIPVFANEAEEASWWFEHREEISQDIVEASRAGRLGVGAVARLMQLREARAQAEAAAKSQENTTAGEQVLASIE